MFSVQKFPINATIPLCEEKRFMGICLPQNLEKLFPDANLALRKDFTQIDSEISVALNTNTKSVKHVTEKCFKCSRQEDNAGKEVFFQEKKGDFSGFFLCFALLNRFFFSRCFKD